MTKEVSLLNSKFTASDRSNNIEQTFVIPSMIGAEVARILADEIIHLKLEPGSRLTEDEICNRFGVSRSPVREALKTLESDGLVVRSAHRGARVAPLTRENLDEVYSCRSALLGVAAAGAAKTASKAARAEISQLLAALEEAYIAKDAQTFFRVIINLTKVIYANCGNDTLIKIVDGIEKQALRYRYLTHIRTTEMQDTSFSGHKEVCEAILTGNAAQARRRAERMIRRVHVLISEALT